MKDSRIKNIKTKYKDLLLYSLTVDKNKWSIESHGAADVSWIEYHSPKYKNIEFCVGHLNFGTCVFINGRIGFSFFSLPFTKLSSAIKEMKKCVKNRVYEDNLNRYEKAINN